MCHLKLGASKPRSCAYPKELKTLGDRIKKRRIDLGLLQRVVGQRIGVSALTITNWEKNHTSPNLKFMPEVIAFLG
jgi:DNA-binding XRE family transcriptional regulator